MAARKSEPFHWRRDVRLWLSDILQYQQQSGLNFRVAASHCQQSFPGNGIVVFVGQSVAKGIAQWAVKTAIQEAATALNLNLNEETIDFLADLAIDVIIPAAA